MEILKVENRPCNFSECNNANNTIMDKRIINIIERAEEEFDYQYSMDDTLQEILDGAEDAILSEINYDIIRVCETNRHYDHISCSDEDLQYEADGQFLNMDESRNKYYRDYGDEYKQIEWYERTDDDYVLMERVVNHEGFVVALIAKL